jgi:hypothetical protein
VTTPAVLPRLRPVPGPGETPGPLMIVVGGVPGAGKSTLLARVADDAPRTVVLDPDRYRRVHTLHAVETMARLARGPRSDAPLLVHDTATRARRRETLGLLARLRGWDPVLVAVDVSLAEALDGQLDRGRVVQPEEFVRHWERWTAQRSALAAADGGPRGPWSGVYLMARCDAYRRVREMARARSLVLAAARPGTAGVVDQPCAA